MKGKPGEELDYSWDVTPEEFQALSTNEQSDRIRAAGRFSVAGLPDPVRIAIEQAEQQRLAEDRIPLSEIDDQRTSKRSQAFDEASVARSHFRS